MSAGTGVTERCASGLQVSGLQLAWPQMRLHFDLCVAPGTCTALIGPSGAGKSTLLAAIAGFEQAQAGRVCIDGVDVTDWPAWRRPVTTVFQEHNLFTHLDVAANVGLGLDPGLRLDGAQRAQVEAALVEVGLAGLGARLPGALSGGERQRVALARALVRRRPLLLLDEPFAALGPALRRDMLGLVDELRRAQGLTVLLVSHHPQDARVAAVRTAFVMDGRILVEDDTQVLLGGGGPPQLASYLGATGDAGPGSDGRHAGSTGSQVPGPAD